MFSEIEAELPPPLFEVGGKENYEVKMRDGILLQTCVVVPAGIGPWPTILIRNPYVVIKDMFLALGTIFSKQGYAVVIQECRGTGTSGGKWEPFINEREDGLDTLDWLVIQEWVDGNIGLYGASYLSFVQWVMVDQLPPQVKTLFLSVFGTERHRQMYMNGMFRHEIYTAWTVDNSGIKSDRDKGELYQSALRVRPHLDMDQQLYGEEIPWYREWLTQVDIENNLWEQGLWADLQKIPEKLNVPVCMVGGWFDHHLDGMVEAYKKIRYEVKKKSRFIIGPWIHSLKTAGDLTYPNSEVIGTSGIKAALEWFNYQLKGEQLDKPLGVVETYVIGDDEWKVWENWPNKTEQKNVYLEMENQLGNKSGILSNDKLPKSDSVSFIYDPNNPVISKGGSALLAWITPNFKGIAPASVLQPEPGYREDVLTFVSPPLKEELLIAGNIKVHLTVSSDVQDTAFSVKVMVVLENGEALNIGDGITSLAYRAGKKLQNIYKELEAVDIEIELWPITWCIKKGSKIRLDISSSNFPAYHIHPNISGPWAEQKSVKIATQTIYFGENHNSFVEIPFVKP